MNTPDLRPHAEIIEWIDAVFPEAYISPKLSDREIMYHAGQRSVVERLQQLLESQRKKGDIDNVLKHP